MKINAKDGDKKNYNTVLTEKQQNYQHYCQVKFINVNILQVQNITF